MAVFIVLWPYLLTTKLRSVIRHNLGHSNLQPPTGKNKLLSVTNRLQTNYYRLCYRLCIETKKLKKNDQKLIENKSRLVFYAT